MVTEGHIVTLLAEMDETWAALSRRLEQLAESSWQDLGKPKDE